MKVFAIGTGILFLMVGGLTIFGAPLAGLNIVLVALLLIHDLRAVKPGPLWRYWALLGTLDLAFFVFLATFGWPGKPLSFVIRVTTLWTLAFWLTAAIGAALIYHGFGLRDRAGAEESDESGA